MPLGRERAFPARQRVTEGRRSGHGQDAAPVLAILYEHLGHPFTILTALPLAGFGALVMLLLFDQELNMFSFVGIILLVGLVKKNGIMMVDFSLTLQREKICRQSRPSSRPAWSASDPS